MRKHILRFVMLIGGIISFGICFGASTNVSAFQQEYESDGGITSCFAPKYNVSKTYRLDYSDSSIPSDLPTADVGQREAIDAYPASTNLGLCFWTDSSKKITGDTPWWVSSSSVVDVTVLASPYIHSSGDTVIEIPALIDCRLAWCGTVVGTVSRNDIKTKLRNYSGSKSPADIAKEIFSEVDGKIGEKSGQATAGNEGHVNAILHAGIGSDQFKEVIQYMSDHHWVDFNIGKVLKVDWSYTYVQDITDNNTDDPGGGGTSGGGGTNSTEPTCENSAGSALGWIICPLLKGTSDAANGVYEKFIEPALQIESGLFKQNNGTYSAWSIMRNFANIALVIFILVIIFSQLTSVGIDNYGIKKALPKVIIAAVLLNLSFIICQILVDLSNIIGASLNAFLTNIGNEIFTNNHMTDTSAISIDGTQIGAANILQTLAGIAVLVGVVAKVGTLIASSGMALLLPLLLIALVVGAAIFFFFVLLAVRQAGVVLLVVVSPIAFVCYMLPNTKSLFDKWKKSLGTLLLLYPICGLLIGGGHLAASILLTSGTTNWFIVLTAMAISVVPVFAIPFVLKSSMQAFGALGGKLAGLTGVGNKLSGKIKGSQGYQNAYTKMAAGKPNGKIGQFRRKFANSKAVRKVAPGITQGYQDSQQAADKMRENDIELATAALNSQYHGDADAELKEYQRLMDLDNLSKQDQIDAEALQRKLLVTPGKAGAVAEVLQKTKHKQFAAEALSRDTNSQSKLYAKNAYTDAYMKAALKDPNIQSYSDWLDSGGGRASTFDTLNDDNTFMGQGKDALNLSLDEMKQRYDNATGTDKDKIRKRMQRMVDSNAINNGTIDQRNIDILLTRAKKEFDGVTPSQPNQSNGSNNGGSSSGGNTGTIGNGNSGSINGANFNYGI